MNGLEIFKYSVRRVLSDLDNAMRISALPYGLYAITYAYFSIRFGEYATMINGLAEGETVPQAPPGFFAWVFINLAMTIVALNWLAVAWHRYVLRGEMPRGWVTPWHGAQNLSYLWKTVLLGVLVSVVTAVVTGLMFFVSGILAIAVGVVVAVIVSLRLGPVLPAAAIGAPVGFADAWRATKGANGALLVLGLVAGAFTIIISIPQMMGAEPGALLTILYDIVVGWFATMISVSVLTTVYSIYIDGEVPN